MDNQDGVMVAEQSVVPTLSKEECMFYGDQFYDTWIGSGYGESYATILPHQMMTLHREGRAYYDSNMDVFYVDGKRFDFVKDGQK
jgi:hypothetical protein